jgi:hypothetical protein
MTKALKLIGGLSLLALATPAAPQNTATASLFGVRPSVEHVDLSPDGKSVVFVAPTVNAASVVLVADIASGKSQPIARATGNPERLSYCNFASSSRLICFIWGLSNIGGELIPFSRLSTMNSDGSDTKQLGQSSSFYDTRLRQFSGSILDWLPDDGTAVLMVNNYIPEGRTGTRMTRSKDGLGVDRVDLRTLKTSSVEPARRHASGT